jgi:hypothetical protein
VGDSKKNEWLADAVAQYGIDILSWPGMAEPSYELAFALYLLDTRVGTRRAVVVYDGVLAGLSKRTPRHFFDATYRSKDEADAQYGLYTARQEWAESVAANDAPMPTEGPTCPPR